jgi:hypothetical protein
MKRDSRVVILVVLLAAVAFEVTKSGFAKDVHFVPPDVATVSDIPYSPDSAASGIVTLSINLDAGGQVQNVQVLRDIPSLTDPAVTAVKSWTFVPGKLEHNAVPSSLNVSVVFNPGNLQNQTLTLGPVQPTPPPNPPGYLPPEIAAASYATYPINSVAMGSVVFDVSVSKSDEIKNVVPIHSVPSLTLPATSALKSWTINTGTFQGKAINSKLVIAFVFRPPTTTTH